MGTLIIELKMPFSPRIFQKGLLFWWSFSLGFPNGTMYFPRESILEAFPISAEDRTGR